MNERIQFLQQRNSAARLTEPGPSAEELESMFSVAMRAPDHARLRPWRFLTISGARRNDLGALLREALLLREPDADIATLDKASCAPLRAPLIVAVITCFCEHPKVPRWSNACLLPVPLTVYCLRQMPWGMGRYGVRESQLLTHTCSAGLAWSRARRSPGLFILAPARAHPNLCRHCSLPTLYSPGSALAVGPGNVSNKE